MRVILRSLFYFFTLFVASANAQANISTPPKNVDVKVLLIDGAARADSPAEHLLSTKPLLASNARNGATAGEWLTRFHARCNENPEYETVLTATEIDLTGAKRWSSLFNDHNQLLPE